MILLESVVNHRGWSLAAYGREELSVSHIVSLRICTSSAIPLDFSSTLWRSNCIGVAPPSCGEVTLLPFKDVPQRHPTPFCREELDPTASGMDPPWHSSPRTPITLRFGLTQPYFHQIEFALLEISDPSSPRWTEHLTKEEVEELKASSCSNLSLSRTNAYKSKRNAKFNRYHRVGIITS
ncbi:uncharacterized protein EI90DRAFT_3080254 [Cantharellus anzutake]|uniref:uncharacterized protein n=1 Tax=Cantharellus anzutake TaxID=1750568 RepID=UPI00190455F1|nr:uncharacterized protein EI90DRAFT_3080254 [Cantharellus anzutake]KAF8321029.1 hypothetical protein EI90DRAFT_3080254 [Cantharellus anzutake]